MSDIPFNRRAVRPLVCMSEGWRNIKSDYWTYLGLTLLGAIIAGAVPFMILAGPMMCGIFMCLLAPERGERPSMDLLFRGFDHFIESLIATMFKFVPMVLIVVPAQCGLFLSFVTMMPNRPPQVQQQQQVPVAGMVTFFSIFIGVALLIAIVSMLISILFSFMYPLIVDRKLKGVAAVKASVKAAKANFGGLLALTILDGLLVFAGMTCCYVGVIFVLPLKYAASAVAYRQVFPAEPEPLALPPGAPSATGIQSPYRM